MTNPSDELRVLLIAPNVSEQMGGEGTKALHIYREIARRGIRVEQITHRRCASELERIAPDMPVHFVDDGWFQRLAWRSYVLRPLVPTLFNYYAACLARQLIADHPRTVVHYTAPVTPVKPHFRISSAPVVIGPQNGNIYHPPAFRNREGLAESLRWRLHPWIQRINRLLFRGKQTANVLLVAGGDRTAQSLRWAGCRNEQFVRCNDSGVLTALAERPLIEHRGPNPRFVHNGRLVPHKGTDLAIKALLHTTSPVTLDIIGRGPFEAPCIELARELGLEERVNFRGWIDDHSKLPEELSAYRGFVFPSLAEANGIVVQEAMMMGLPTICLRWGGPELLVDNTCGFAIEPRNEEHVVKQIAAAMDRLATDDQLANQLAQAGRDKAMREGFRWSDIVDKWVGMYRRLDPGPAHAPGDQFCHASVEATRQ